ncbi:MAG: hypothetical protein IJC83_03845, partial [Oscillospiraceae bacterium]|nr:hypothetical protein [Oscillospiraceae bacterium]
MNSGLFVLIFLAFFWLIVLLTYIIKSIGVFKISKKQGTSHPILAWIPIINICYFGFIADKIKTENGKRAHNKLALVISTIISVILFILTVVFSVISGVMSSYLDMQDLAIIMTLITFLVVFLFTIAVLVVNIFTYISSYAIYAKYKPNNKVL